MLSETAKMKTSWTPLLLITLSTPILYVLHSFSMAFFPEPFRVEGLTNIYLFLYVMYAVVLTLLVWIEKKHPEQLGFAFLGGGLIKMMAVVFYLLPDLLAHVPNAKALVVQTMLPYFVLLALETRLIYARIRQIL